jgi:hypothetical protein
MSTVPRSIWHSSADELSFRLKDESPPWAHIVYSAIIQIKRTSQVLPMRAFLPYRLHHTGRTDGARCVVNRNYSVVGSTGVWSDYDTADGWHVPRERFEELHSIGVVNERGSLYNDGTSPRLARADLVQYRSKVAELLSPWMK